MDLAKKLHAAFIQSGKTLALAEACTGGAIAAKLTALPGASQFFLGSLVVYSNAWKELFLGVSSHTLKTKGAVSEEAVIEMVEGLFARTTCDVAAAVSGIAGPTVGSDQIPVGTIYLAVGNRGKKIRTALIHAPKSRAAAIETASKAVLQALYDNISIN